MPTFEFRCEACGRIFERFASIREKEEGSGFSCPSCGSDSTRQIFTGVQIIASGPRGEVQTAASCGCGGQCGCR